MNEIELTGEIREEIVDLAGAMREGTIEDIDIVRLDQLLCECPGAVELYTELALLTSDLKDVYGNEFALPTKNNTEKEKKNSLAFPAFLLAAAAILAISFFISVKEKHPVRGMDIAVVNAALRTEFEYGGKDGKEIEVGEQISERLLSAEKRHTGTEI